MSYQVTKNRIVQWVGIIVILCLFGGAYWYFKVYAGYKTNVSPTGSLTSGLVGYWTFDGADTSSTTATDRGIGGNGTLTGGPTVTQGKLGQALDFDGTNDYVTVASDADLQLTSALTISVWVKPDSVTTGSILTKGSDNNNYNYNLRFLSGKIQYGWRNNAGCCGGDTYYETAGTYTAGSWYHIVATHTSGSTPKIYVNGIEVSGSMSTGLGTYALVNFASAFEVGRFGTSSDFFNGAVDEVRVYNTALTTAQIQSLYKAGESDVMNVADINGNLNSGLAGYWAMNEGTGTSATDSSINGNTGTLTNGPTWTTGQIGNAVTVDGVNDYIDIGRTAITSTSALTLSAWVSFPTGSETQYLFGNVNGQSGSDGQAFMVDNSGTQNIYGMAGVVATTTNAVTPSLNTWYHFVDTFDGTTERIYVNGVLIKSGAGAMTQASENNVLLGRNTTGGGTFYGNFSIDEARVYTRALAGDEVAQLYRYTGPAAADSGLVGHWSFNGTDTTSTKAYDRSGTGNTGTLTGGPTIAEGKVGQALSFDGTNDYVTIPNAASLNSTAQVTVSAWIKRSGTGTRQFFVSKGNASTVASTQYWLELTAGNVLVFELASGSTEHKLTSSFTLTDTQNWHHVVGTYDGTTQKIFLDGVQDTTTSTWSGALNAVANDLVIGNRSSGYDIPFNGKVDEVRVYNTAITTAQIQAQYAMGQSDEVNAGASQAQGTGRLDSGLSGYWKLDDGSGTSATDSSTNGNTGTLTGNASWTTGQIGGAATFDGTDDYITVGNNASTNVTGKITVSGWIYSGTNSSDQDVISKYDGNSAVQYLLLVSSTGTTLNFYTGDGNGTNAASATIPLATWTHVTGIYDGTNTKLYINGTFISNAVAPLAPVASGTGLYLGTRLNGLRDFNGKLDEVRIYNRALSADEVSQLYQLNAPSGTDTGLKGYWSFNGRDISGTSAADRSGAGNTGSLTNGPAVTEGRLGQGLSFDGVNDYVDLGTGSSIRYTTTGSIAVWVKTSCTGTCVIIGGNSDTEIGYNLFLESGTLKYRQNKFNEMSTPWTGVYNDGNWHFVVVSKSGANGTLYVDNVSKATSTGLTGSWGAHAIYLGNEYNRAYYFSGSLDEVRVYDRALTTAEITSLYNASR